MGEMVVENSPVVLSICIPTYNRGEILSGNVKSWLANQNDRYEIVVSDNNSSDNTAEIFSSIYDKRLVFVKNDKNIGSENNIKRSIEAASGKYVMLLMDKDLLVMDYINDIINYLEANDFAAGAFLNNYTGAFDVYNYGRTANSLKEFCLKGRHPSGIIMKKELYLRHHVSEICSKSEMKAHMVDFMTAILAQYGDIVLLKIPFVNYVYPPFKGVKHSYTYSQNLENLFFSPECKFNLYEAYLKFLTKEIAISDKERLYILRALVKDAYLNCTSVYHSILLNHKNICDWYNLSEEFISKELKHNYELFFLLRLLKSNAYKSILEHLYVVFYFIGWYIFKRRHK